MVAAVEISEVEFSNVDVSVRAWRMFGLGKRSAVEISDDTNSAWIFQFYGLHRPRLCVTSTEQAFQFQLPVWE